MDNYHDSIKITTTSEKAFNALSKDIPLWWTEMFEGSAYQKDNIFTVRFGDSVFKTIKVKEISPNSKIVWHVENSLIAIPELKNQTEWIGTTITWEIKQKHDILELVLTHIGLDKSIECYDICSNGWQQFTASLKSFLETGIGSPFKKPK